MSAGVPAGDRVFQGATRVWFALRWPIGMAIATYRLSQRVDVVRHTEERPGLDPEPSDRRVPGDGDAVQPRIEGAGPSSRRRYRVGVRGARASAQELISTLAIDPNLASPFEVARFVKTAGRLGELEPGDEYLVQMPGPWDGPVRVADRTPTSFRLATLHGHMEAGEIEFSARDTEDGLTIEIESSARSGSRASWLVYGPLRLGAEMQLHMWVHFLERAAHLAGGTPDGPVAVSTLRYPDDRGRPSREASRRAMRMLDGLRSRAPNFTPEGLQAHDAAEGWRVDDHAFDLPAEPPGAPEEGGSWERAVGFARDYAFADPSLIQAVYYPDEPLERRDMLLEGRFLGLRFMLGVRVLATVDGPQTIDGRSARVWGWSYGTLQGHLEMGRMDYLVVKFPDTGEVQFRIHAVSRAAGVRNPLVRAGFRLFGRGLQLRFARTAGARMQALVRRSMGAPAGAAHLPASGDRPPGSRASVEPAA